MRFNAEDFNGQVVLATATWGAIHSYSTFLNTPTPTFWGHSEREKKNESGVQIISTGLTEEPIRKGTSDVRGFTCIPPNNLNISPIFSQTENKYLSESIHS